MHGQHFITCYLPDIPGDVKTLKMAFDFCEGLEPDLSPANVVPLSCTASYLDMTEAHSPNNLLNFCLTFLHRKVLPSWSSSLQALQSCERLLDQADAHGLVVSCVDSIAAMAAANPSLLLGKLVDHASIASLQAVPNTARRALFSSNLAETQDLVELGLPLFELAISAMFRVGVPSEYAADCLFRYTAKHLSKEVMEAVEKLLPPARGMSRVIIQGSFAMPCKMLSEMLRLATQVQAGHECRKGLEARMSRHLHQAVAEDLLIPCHGYSKETQYDVECVIRMLKDFYGNYSLPDTSGIVHVLHLVTAYLSHVAGDPCLRIELFVSLAGMVAFTLAELGDCTDAVYGAIDGYLSAHRHLTESEKEKVCRLLDVHRMSSSALGHAAQNERLPLRLVVQVLFVLQFRMQDAINIPDQGLSAGNSIPVLQLGSKEKDVTGEVADMGARLLGEECVKSTGDGSVEGRGRKVSLWKDLKRKMGCKNGGFDMEDETKYHLIKKQK